MAKVIRKVCCKITHKQYLKIKELAKNDNCTMNDYFLKKLGLDNDRKDKVNLTDILERLPLKKDTEFSLPSLFKIEEWMSFTKGSRISVGRAFFAYITRSDNNIKIQYLQKSSSNLAIYKKN